MLEVEGLRVTYGAVEAVHGISFSVAKGEVVALIGANGAGKTSTLAALSGLIRPSGGSIRPHGRELVGAPPPRTVAAGGIPGPEGRGIPARLSVAGKHLPCSRGRGGVP